MIDLKIGGTVMTVAELPYLEGKEIKVGSLVLLKSGGPIMTVDHIRNNEVVDAVWFADENTKRDAFDLRQLIFVQS